MMKICLDCDDTLYDLSMPFRNTMEQFFPGVFESHDFERMYQDYRGHGDALFDLIQDGTITPDDSGILRIVKLCQQYNLEMSVLDAWEFQKTYRDFQYKIYMEPEFLAYLQNFDGKIAILTNGQETHQKKKLESLQVSTFAKPENVFTSQYLGYRKPDPRAFLKAMELMKEDAKDWYYIGDSYENDMAGGKTAGMKTIHLNRHHQPSGPAADYEVFSEAELMDLLDTLQKQEG